MASELNVKPGTIFCRDNLDVLRGINSECIDLIYLDPPFNKKKTFTAHRPHGTHGDSDVEGAGFRDIFRREDVKGDWMQRIEGENEGLHLYLSGLGKFSSAYNYCYLVYMAIRLVECRRILKNTGSLYLHCDPTMSHYLKIVLDCIFGEGNFRNEIAWCYSSTSQARRWFPRKHDIIFFYTKSAAYPFNADDIRVQFKKPLVKHGKTWQSGDEAALQQLTARGKIPEDHWSDVFPVNSMAKERTGYPTQKPLALLERIIKASSREGDVVLDPFCGGATTCVAAEKLGRRWIGVDVSRNTYALVKKRLKDEVTPPSANLANDAPHRSTTPPKRTC